MPRTCLSAAYLTATSVGITARVLRDLGQDRTDEARVILGAAVIDDVLCLIVLAVVSGLAVTGQISVPSIALTTAKAAIFLVASLGIGIWLTPKLVRRISVLGIQNLKLLFGISFAFLLSWLANVAELATIVGAFAAGMVLNSFFDREVEGISLHELLSPIESLGCTAVFRVDGNSGEIGSHGADRRSDRGHRAHRGCHHREGSFRLGLPKDDEPLGGRLRHDAARRGWTDFRRDRKGNRRGGRRIIFRNRAAA